LTECFAEDVTETSTGHKLLPPYIRVIQGDGVDWESIPAILESLKQAGFAADNMVFGSGGALLQKVNRDTFKCAFKCSEITVSGTTREVFKDPITDLGKASKKGRLTLMSAEDVASMGFTDADKYQPRQQTYEGDPDGIPGGTGFLHYSPDGKFVTVASGKGDPSKDILVDVFKDGEIVKEYTLDEIRKKADIPNGPWSQTQS
jgi:nicotinamide phosphoribosyltransferase